MRDLNAHPITKEEVLTYLEDVRKQKVAVIHERIGSMEVAYFNWIIDKIKALPE
jgi:hypothetical protein